MMNIEESYRLLTAAMDNHNGKIIIEEDKMTSFNQKRKLLMTIRTMQNFSHNLTWTWMQHILCHNLFIVNRRIFSA